MAGKFEILNANGKTITIENPDSNLNDKVVDLSDVAKNSELNTPNSEIVKTALNASGTAPIYACRAWVNFNGQGTVAIRASGNVSSITDNGVGDYTVNFIASIEDTNYNETFGSNITNTAVVPVIVGVHGLNSGAPTLKTTSKLRIISVTTAPTQQIVDNYNISLSITR